jgi:hypothetical protein
MSGVMGVFQKKALECDDSLGNMRQQRGNIKTRMLTHSGRMGLVKRSSAASP